MCPEERRRRNIKTCCVSLEMAMGDMMYFFFSFSFFFSFERELCFFFFCFSVFFLFFYFFIFKGSDSKGTVRSGLIMVLRTVRLNRDSNSSLLFGYRPVLEHKNHDCERFTVFPVGPYGPVRVSKP